MERIGLLSSTPSCSQTDEQKKQSTTMNYLCKKNRKRGRNDDCTVGTSTDEIEFKVGFKFRKYFPGYGYFNGEVTELRETSNGEFHGRRCVYTDGDVEDITVENLRLLVNTNGLGNHKQSKANTIIPSKETDAYEHKTSVVRNKANTCVWDTSIPIDEAAETITKMNQGKHKARPKRSSDDFSSCSEDQEVTEWYEKTASILASGGQISTNTSATASKKRIVEFSSYEDVSNATIFNLSSYAPSKRFGQKVVFVNDKKSIIGEVILAQKGWVEAVINQEVIKARPKDFLVTPPDSVIGEMFSMPLLNNDKRKNRVQELNKKFSFAMMPSPDGSVISDSSKSSSSATTTSTSLDRAITNSSSETILKERNMTLSSFFYWHCDQCKDCLSFLKRKCDACRRARGPDSILSPLLAKAEEILKSSNNNITEALSSLPFTERKAITAEILGFLSKNNRSSLRSDRRIQSLNDYYNWSCGYCTAINSYKRVKCEHCYYTKSYLSQPSIMYKIALTATKASTVKEANDIISIFHRPAVPQSVLNFLITCTAEVKRGKKTRRCQRPKKPGMEYCTLHCDPFSFFPKYNASVSNSTTSAIPGSIVSIERKDETEFASEERNSFTTSSSISSNKETEKALHEESIQALQSTISKFLVSTTIIKSIVNTKAWHNVHDNIEDAIFCQTTKPFPLGMLARRYFPEYGFHDARVVNIRRCKILDKTRTTLRPVLIYRIRYDDGDEEELLHHQLNSLRQFYRCRTIASEEPTNKQMASPSVYDTKHGLLEMDFKNLPSTTLVHERGNIVKARVFKNTPNIENSTTNVNVNMFDLTTLQFNVSKRLTTLQGEESEKEQDPLEGEYFTKSNTPSKCFSHHKAHYSPVLEWPGFDSKISTPLQKENKIMIVNGLSLFSDAHENDWKPSSIDTEKTSSEDSEEFVRCDVNNNNEVWDPANILSFVAWDPYKNVTCQVCNRGDKEHQLLLCDKCNLGFHTFCVRPVLVKIPISTWHCHICSDSSNRKQQTVADMTLHLKGPEGQKEVIKYLNLPFEKPTDFRQLHNMELSKFSASKRPIIPGTTQARSTAKIGDLYFSSYNKKYEKNWVIPTPIINTELYASSLTSFVAATKFCGVEKYSEELVYANEDLRKLNVCNSEKVEPMNKVNLDIFRQYKYNISKGAYPPIKVVYDERVGFTVEALAKMPRHTLITEYIGEVTTFEQADKSSSDSLMKLNDTGDPSTSLIIDPTRVGNIARFLSGVNNRSIASKRKANVRTRRFMLDGQNRIALFTSRAINKGEKLHYDYNLGLENKGVGEWEKIGFYDTSNFF